VQQPQREVAAFVAGVGDLLCIGRPARITAVKLAEREGQGRIAAGGGEPQLMPLPALETRIDHALAVGRDVGPHAPAAFPAAQRGSRLTACERVSCCSAPLATSSANSSTASF